MLTGGHRGPEVVCNSKTRAGPNVCVELRPLAASLDASGRMPMKTSSSLKTYFLHVVLWYAFKAGRLDGRKPIVDGSGEVNSPMLVLLVRWSLRFKAIARHGRQESAPAALRNATSPFTSNHSFCGEHLHMKSRPHPIATSVPLALCGFIPTIRSPL
ncbi:hypothetical protein FA95DRAFT_787662 [Auriscalpium vulgare]|uniref:Uncharacterized protein n=1 Tax=Auriscalpium vulgare TaxID=40419 RepID=A0ACB8RA85_9AGAM|nr:hypothetical protein FA95DRAFT_787662 [Auriscalpium vulgare]